MLLAKLIYTIKGLRKTAYHHYGRNWISLLRFLYYSVFNLNTFVVYGTILDDNIPIYDLDEGYKVITPTQEQLENLRHGLGLSREFYYDRIHGVKRCYVVLYGDEIAYIHWVYTKGDPNRFLRLDEGTVELNYNTTLPKFRGLGLMSKMMAYIARDLRKQGYKKVVGVIHKKNPPALRSAEKAGWSEIVRIRTIGPFNKKLKI